MMSHAQILDTVSHFVKSSVNCKVSHKRYLPLYRIAGLSPQQPTTQLFS